MSILKNTLARLVFQQINLTTALQFLDGPTALVFPPMQEESDVAIRLARRLTLWRDKYKVLEIKGGILEGRVVTPPEIRQIAVLPAREIILSQFGSALNAPLYRLVTDLKGLINKMGCLLKTLADKQEKA